MESLFSVSINIHDNVSTLNTKYSYKSHNYDLTAKNPQDAVDMAYSRTIAMWGVFSNESPSPSQNLVVERKDIYVRLICYFEHDSNKLSMFAGEVEHPSRLTDSQIKQMIMLDIEKNGFSFDKQKLENMVFLI